MDGRVATINSLLDVPSLKSRHGVQGIEATGSTQAGLEECVFSCMSAFPPAVLQMPTEWGLSLIAGIPGAKHTPVARVRAE